MTKISPSNGWNYVSKTKKSQTARRTNKRNHSPGKEDKSVTTKQSVVANIENIIKDLDEHDPESIEIVLKEILRNTIKKGIFGENSDRSETWGTIEKDIIKRALAEEKLKSGIENLISKNKKNSK